MNLKTAMCLSLCEEDVGFYGNNNLLYVTQWFLLNDHAYGKIFGNKNL
jgi:hypothetical protein